jgi:hypothetical protein
LAFAGCVTEPDTVDNDATNVIINVVRMTGTEGGTTAGTESDFLLSDVCFADKDHPPCSVFNDNGSVQMQAISKDQTQRNSPINSVVFERYRVTFVRADGRNVPGVDVPYPFDGAVNFTVPVGGTASGSFIVVRHQAKGEPPLLQMAQSGQGLLSVIAQIDFYGHDLSGRSYKVTGYLNITFADFGNE